MIVMREYTEQRRRQLEDHLFDLCKTHNNKMIGVAVRMFLEGVCKEILIENDKEIPNPQNLSLITDEVAKTIFKPIVHDLKHMTPLLNKCAHHTHGNKMSFADIETILILERRVFMALYGDESKAEIEYAFNNAIKKIKNKNKSRKVWLFVLMPMPFLAMLALKLTPFSPPDKLEHAIGIDEKSGIYHSDGKVTIQSLRKRPPEHIKEALRAYSRYKISYLYRQIDDIKRELMPALKCFYNKKDYSADDFIKRRFSNKKYTPNIEKPRVIILKTDPKYWSDDWVYISAVEEDDVAFMEGQIIVFQKLNGEWKFAAEFFPKDPKQSRCAPKIDNGRLIW